MLLLFFIKFGGYKMKYLIGILIVALLLVSCTPEETTEVDASDDVVDVVEDVKDSQETGQEETQEETDDAFETDSVKETREKLSEESKEVLELAKQRVKNYAYTYFGVETGQFEYDYAIKDGKIRITIDKDSKYQKTEDDYRVVYLDTVDETAIGVCEERSLCKVNLEPIDLVYTDWRAIKTPLDYLAEITEYEIISTEVIDGRENYRGESNIGMVWIDIYTGLPMQVEQDGVRVLEIADLKFNQLKDEEVVYTGTK